MRRAGRGSALDQTMRCGSVQIRTIGGMNSRLAPVASIASRSPATLCERRLSMMTTSPGLSVGTRTCWN